MAKGVQEPQRRTLHCTTLHSLRDGRPVLISQYMLRPSMMGGQQCTNPLGELFVGSLSFIYFTRGVWAQDYSINKHHMIAGLCQAAAFLEVIHTAIGLLFFKAIQGSLNKTVHGLCYCLDSSSQTHPPS